MALELAQILFRDRTRPGRVVALDHGRSEVDFHPEQIMKQLQRIGYAMAHPDME